MPFRCGNLTTGHHLNSVTRGQRQRFPHPFHAVMVGDGDHVQVGVIGHMFQNGRDRGGPVITVNAVNVKI